MSFKLIFIFEEPTPFVIKIYIAVSNRREDF